MDKIKLCIRLVAEDWSEAIISLFTVEALKFLGVILVAVAIIAAAVGSLAWPLMWLTPYIQIAQDAGKDWIAVAFLIGMICIYAIQYLGVFFIYQVKKKCDSL